MTNPVNCCSQPSEPAYMATSVLTLHVTSTCRSTPLSEPVYLAMAAHGISATKNMHRGMMIACREMMTCFMTHPPLFDLWLAASSASYVDSNPTPFRQLSLGHHPDRTPQGLIGPVQRAEERTGLRSRRIRFRFTVSLF